MYTFLTANSSTMDAIAVSLQLKIHLHWMTGIRTNIMFLDIIHRLVFI
jgi:hypothetical protein